MHPTHIIVSDGLFLIHFIHDKKILQSKRNFDNHYLDHMNKKIKNENIESIYNLQKWNCSFNNFNAINNSTISYFFVARNNEFPIEKIDNITKQYHFEINFHASHYISTINCEKINQLSRQLYKFTGFSSVFSNIFCCILLKLGHLHYSRFFSNLQKNNEINYIQSFISPNLSKFKKSSAINFKNFSNDFSYSGEKSYETVFKVQNHLIYKFKNIFISKFSFDAAANCKNINNLQFNQILEQIVDENSKYHNHINLIAEYEFALAKTFHHQYRNFPKFKAIYPNSNKNTLTSEIIEPYSQNEELFSTIVNNIIENYMKTIIHTSKYDLESLFSIIGILFELEKCKLFQKVPKVLQMMNNLFNKIDPDKFCPVFYQLAANIDEYNTNFQILLRKMVISICRKSPNECFPILFSLIKSRIKNFENLKNDTIKDLISIIIGSSCKLFKHWNQMNSLFNGYLQLSFIPKISSVLKINEKLRNFSSEKNQYVTIITNSNNIGISRFEDKVTVLSGRSKPFLIEILGTDGKTYRQIYKGNDDLRQDVIIQQIFVFYKKLLSKKANDLSIRNYKVVPISPKSGLIEYVENSNALQNYIQSVYKNTSLERFLIMNQFKDFYMKSINYHKDQTKTEKSRRSFINYFIELRKKIKPVFHFFFNEKFKNYNEWYAARLRYCKHTATNSMIGHILGIGDRHLNNILVDEKTGEIIHIDFGIAFDQGKFLPVKEIVPFRLTNEIIDGMELMWKDGTFRKTCNESMTVLRNNADYLLTMLSVMMMNDPSCNKNTTSFSEKNKKFDENYILTCQNKLEGKENGNDLSVEDQVLQLINDSTNDENLAMMFHGWKPFL